MDRIFYGNSVQDWLISLGIIAGSIILAKLLYLLVGKVIKKLTTKTKTKLDDILVDLLEEPVVYAIVIGSIWYSLGRLSFSESVDGTITKIFSMAYILNVTWGINRIIKGLIEEYIVPLTEKTETDLDDQLLPIARKAITFIIWAMGIVIGLNNIGIDVTAMIAGLGVGGLALAMAAKDSVANFFGGITILTDKPFVMGDRVRIDSYDGKVEEIGIRSTRLRTLEGRLVTIPNSAFIDSPVENITNEPTRKVTLSLGLTYEMTHHQMRDAMGILADISEKNQDLITDEYKIGFDTFGDFSLGIKFIYYIQKDADILEVQTTMNTEILERFNDSGLDMAFPTQTIHNK